MPETASMRHADRDLVESTGLTHALQTSDGLGSRRVWNTTIVELFGWPVVRDPSNRDNNMHNSEPGDVTRPTMCPFCESKIIDTQAKVITVTTCWRCRECERTWTIASMKSSSARFG
jgi:hypothetical protein